LNLASYLFNFSEENAKDFLYVAHQLSLVDSYQKTATDGTIELRYRLHPLIAEFLRNQFKNEEFKTSFILSSWFSERLPEPSPSKLNWIQFIYFTIFKLFRIRYYVYNPQFPYQAWHELNNEHDVLRSWLARIPLDFGFGMRIVRLGSSYAHHNGPWASWRQFCEKLLASALSDEARSYVLWTTCRCAVSLGDLEQAYQLAQQKAQLDQQLGNEQGYALAKGQIADILDARGELYEVLRIRQETILVFERLGDVRSLAVILGKIADILYRRNKLDEALRIQQETILVFEDLGDVRSRAATLGKIADILCRRDELDEALRIRQQEQMPVYERLGDVHARAVTLGKIADILQARGELDEALRIRQQEQMPVYERLGDVLNLSVAQVDTAFLLMKFTPPRDEEANQLLCLALAVVENADS